MCIIGWGVLRFTEIGFRIRAVGANPDAARSAGSIAVGRTVFLVFVMSGSVAGLAGAVEVTGVTFALYESLSPGYGYTAIAVALLARLHPIGVIGTGILFGALQSGGAAMQRDAAVPSVLVSIVEAILILGIVTLATRKSWFDRLRQPSIVKQRVSGKRIVSG
jgi:simple sugar transport system permease protein